MKEFQDTDDRPDGEEVGFESAPASLPSYDPLLTPWEESPVQETAPIPEPADGFYLSPPSMTAALPAHDEALAWELPPSAVLRHDVSAGSEAGAWYPDRFQAPYGERMTELQRRLREETITIPRPERRWAVTIREVVETLLLAVLIFLAVRASFQNFRVEGESMHPSLEDGEYLIVNKLTYARLDLSIFNFLPFFDAGDSPEQHLWGSPSRGDVIVFKSPTSPGRDFIKRIMAMPGDTITIDGGKVTVNGNVLEEPYATGITNCNGECTRTIPAAGTPESRAECGSDACYYVMGDNRQNSSDSRQGWYVPEENIIGKALITYWHEGGPELNLAPNASVAADAPSGE